ncbi:DUF2612 domain-containing protein [Arcobacter lacus]|uniref:DUF2612 domain-containing protein n=1 Tax=Arcobacter lacus TaxID=1912876 RepID=A0ABX5JHA7_9BACT|nr:DUF2612 domain-containing protein [Arcobacter lacus]PUE66764.1 hypothetical protein B0175_05200 [Arcobacter lacus]
MSFIEEYEKLLIWQYQDKPKAKEHIRLLLTEYKNIYDLLNSIPDAFDLDKAVGKQQDILGKILGISRNVPFAVPKKYFGFEDQEDAYGFDDLAEGVLAYPFRDLTENDYTSGQLDDYQFRLFLKAKAIKNNVKAKMIDDDTRLSLQNAIDFLFSSKAYIVDNKDMTMDIFIDLSFDFSLIKYIQELDLLPRPQGVEYRFFQSFSNDNTFGFEDTPDSKPMGDFDNLEVGGVFADIIII